MGLAAVTWLEYVAGVLERGSRRNAGKRCGSRLSDRAPAHPTRPASRTRCRFIGEPGWIRQPASWTPLQLVRTQRSGLL